MCDQYNKCQNDIQDSHKRYNKFGNFRNPLQTTDDDKSGADSDDYRRDYN